MNKKTKSNSTKRTPAPAQVEVPKKVETDISIKLTNREIFEGGPFLSTLSKLVNADPVKHHVPAKVRNKLGDIVDAINKIVKSLNNTRTETIKAYTKKDKDGEPVKMKVYRMVPPPPDSESKDSVKQEILGQDGQPIMEYDFLNADARKKFQDEIDELLDDERTIQGITKIVVKLDDFPKELLNTLEMLEMRKIIIWKE